MHSDAETTPERVYRFRCNSALLVSPFRQFGATIVGYLRTCTRATPFHQASPGRKHSVLAF
jgi:hypothetical protein